VAGPRRVWSDGERGNYWDTATARRGPFATDRPYSPTDPVTAHLDRPGHLTLSRAPAVLALRALRGSVPGMRSGGVVDESPALAPTNPDRLSVLNARSGERHTAQTDTTSERTTELNQTTVADTAAGTRLPPWWHVSLAEQPVLHWTPAEQYRTYA